MEMEDRNADSQLRRMRGRNKKTCPGLPLGRVLPDKEPTVGFFQPVMQKQLTQEDLTVGEKLRQLGNIIAFRLVQH